jgi:catechol 2,3-dioxygenase
VSEAQLPASTRIGRVRLRVADLSRSLAFYEQRLGLESQVSGKIARLRAPGADEAIIELNAVSGTTLRPRSMPGLYHFALLFPDRHSFGRMLLHLVQQRWPFQGFADHLVSEAAYLADPDGNGIELYCDRPRERWPRKNGEIEMDTRVLDVNSLLRAVDGTPWSPPPPSLSVGHVHLHVTALDRCADFYERIIGFGVVTRRYPGAVFLAAGGYHHHLGINSWAATQARDPDAAGLLDFEIVTGSLAARDAVAERAASTGIPIDHHDGAVRLADPDGNGILVS